MGTLAIVTGASSGIGRETARQLAGEGWTVVVIARREERLNELVAEFGESIVPFALDGGDGEAVLQMAESVLTEHGTPDAIVNSAGAGAWRDIEDTSPEELQSMMDAPFASAFHVVHAFMSAMLREDRGVLIHINSPACIAPWAGSTGYTCSRWALRGLHEALQQDLAGTNIETCHVIFGEVSSEYFDANENTRKNQPTLGKLFPVSTPEACAKVVVETIERPKGQVIYPAAMALQYYSFKAAPWLTKFLIRATQRRR